MYIFQYTQSSLQFNIPLWRGKFNDRVKARVEGLKEELEKCPLYGGTLYRGTSLRSLQRMGNLKLGNQVSDLGFLSSSTSEEEARRFGPWMMKIIQNKTGRKLQCSQFPSEKEVLFGPGVKWKIIYFSEAERLLEVEEV